MRFLNLTTEERQLINSLYKTSSNAVVRKRCLFVKLSLKNHSMKAISALTDDGWYSIWRFFNAWESAKTLAEKEATLHIKAGRGVKPKLGRVKEIVPDLVREHNRNLNAVVSILSEKHDVKICKTTLQAFLKEAQI